MNINYSDETMAAFESPKYVYSNEEYNIIGHAGDTTIGEIVHLYFKIQKHENYINSEIISARFSAMGGVMLIAAAEKFCSVAHGKSFQEVLQYCDPENGLAQTLTAPEDKTYSVNFVIQAFYNALETLTVS